MKLKLPTVVNDQILPLLMGLGMTYLIFFYLLVFIILLAIILMPFAIYSFIKMITELQEQLKNTSNPEIREILKDNCYMKFFIGGGLFIFIYWIFFSILDGNISLAPITDIRDGLIGILHSLE